MIITHNNKKNFKKNDSPIPILMKHCFILLSSSFFLFSFFENIISLSFYAKVCIKFFFPLKTTRLDLSHIHCYDHILRDFRKPWPSCPFRITPCWNLWATGRNMCVQVTRPHFLIKKKKITQPH